MFGPFSGSPWVMCDPSTYAYWNDQSLEAGTSVVQATNGDLFGYSKVQLVFDRTTPVGTREDVEVFSMAWGTPAGTVCTPLGAGDKAVVEAAINTWFGSIKTYCSTQLTFREMRWYDYQPINTRPGPVVRTTASGVAGSAGTARMPDQLCIDQTFKTCSRKHWGRWYLPFIRPTDVDTTYGRVVTASYQTQAAYTRTLLQTSGGSGLICPVVASIGYKAVMGIRELQVDNVFDVIRSRRPKVANGYQRYTS